MNKRSDIAVDWKYFVRGRRLSLWGDRVTVNEYGASRFVAQLGEVKRQNQYA